MKAGQPGILTARGPPLPSALTRKPQALHHHPYPVSSRNLNHQSLRYPCCTNPRPRISPTRERAALMPPFHTKHLSLSTALFASNKPPSLKRMLYCPFCLPFILHTVLPDALNS